MKKQYNGQIKILCGLEAAHVPEAMQDLIDLKKYCDFVLLGQHQGGLNDRKYGLSCDDEELVCYTKEIEKGIETGYYNILAHPDFFMSARTEWNDECGQNAYRICMSAKKHKIPLELNIKGSYSMFNGVKCIKYPFRRFWEIAADVGNEVLYGWDAHSPKEILRTTEGVDKIIDNLALNMVENIEPYINISKLQRDDGSLHFLYNPIFDT